MEIRTFTFRKFALTLLLGAVFFAESASARKPLALDHVLIMTISNYAQQELIGVKHDANNALKIASKLGFDVSQAMIFKDSQLTAKGLRDAIEMLSEKVWQNDRVFIYYSGHGYSQKEGNQCVQSLVGQDLALISSEEIDKQLDIIKKKLPSNVFVLIDSCHSGGLRDMVVNRDLSSTRLSKSTIDEGGRLNSKAFNAKSGESCDTAVNIGKAWTPVLARDMNSKGTVFPQNNFTFIAAANEREQALDDSQRGGLATVNIHNCLESGVKDIDGNGTISATELIACAQEKVNADVPLLNARANKKYLPHTLEAYGNKTKSLNTVKVIAVAQNNVQVSPLEQNNSSGNSANSTSTQKISYTSDALRTLNSFQTFVSGSNGNWAASVDMPQRVKFGDKAPVYYSSSQPGFMTILYVGSDGKEIKAITEASIPIEASDRKYAGAIPIIDCVGTTCAGKADTFLVIFSQRALDTNSLLGSAKNGDKVRIDSQVMANLGCATDSKLTRMAGSMQIASACGEEVKRMAGKMEVAKGAVVDGYAARIATVIGY